MSEWRVEHQAWAEEAYRLLSAEVFEGIDHEGFALPPSDRAIVSYGFGHTDAARAECWIKPSPEVDAVILVGPQEWTDARNVLAVLTHEMIHAGFPQQVAHGEPFLHVADMIGLLGGVVADTPNDALTERLNAVRDSLPPFPGVPLPKTPPGGVPGDAYIVPEPKRDETPAPKRKPQKGRMRLFECICGVKVRAGRDELIATCGLCNQPFERQS